MTRQETRLRQVFSNGINAVTGGRLAPPLSLAELSKLVRGQRPDPELEQQLRRRVYDLGATLGVAVDDPQDLAQTGWGVVFARDTSPAVIDALAPLLDLRRRQAGDRYRAFTGDCSPGPGESAPAFLRRHGADGTGPANPTKVPYYLLLVGAPASTSYQFQYRLDVQYAVGRIHFDSPQQYADYAQAIRASEDTVTPSPRTASFFGTAHENDPATQASAGALVAPLAAFATQQGWQTAAHLGDEATKAQLCGLLGGTEAPTFLFAATHGVAFPLDHPQQRARQGALICKEWSGLTAAGDPRGPLTESHYVSADDVLSDANMRGRLAFFFACYSAGAPQYDEFTHLSVGTKVALAPHDFDAGLPRRLLTLSRGGALAVIGHVERVWGYSFLGPERPELQTFKAMLQNILAGYRIGRAMEIFNQRYAELSTDLSDKLAENLMPGEEELAELWTARNDARSYVVIGDPAVRLRVDPASD